MSAARHPGVAVVLLALAGCGTTAASEAPAATDESPAASTVSSTVPDTVSSSVATTAAATAPPTERPTTTPGRDAMSTTTHHRTVVSADAGSVAAQYVDGVLDVHIESKPGWSPTVDRSAPNRVRVSWALGERIVAVEITADDVGLSSQVLTTG